MRTFAVALLVSVTAALSAQAQLAQPSSVLDGSGTRSSGGTYNHISAAGQPGGMSESSSGQLVNQAGFLHTFFLRPDLDTDGDGLPDEADSDNDGDTLADLTELTGSAFNPVTPTEVNVADTDSDGAADGAEAAAGTDPTDPSVALQFVAVSRNPTADVCAVAWLARGNHEKTYVLREHISLLLTNALVCFSNTVAGGAPPWYVVTNWVAVTTPTNAAFYRVSVEF